MMKIVKNNNIMELLELYEGENYIYCLCELYSGGHLLDHIVKYGHFDELSSLRYIKQLLKVLPYTTKLTPYRL